MRRVRTCINLAVGLALVLGFGSVLAQWLMTGELHVTDRIPGQYVTFAQEPIGFLMALAIAALLVGAGLLLIALAIVKD